MSENNKKHYELLLDLGYRNESLDIAVDMKTNHRVPCQKVKRNKKTNVHHKDTFNCAKYLFWSQ